MFGPFGRGGAVPASARFRQTPGVPRDRTIRDAVEADAPAVAALIVELGYPATEDLARERIATFAADAASRMLVADLDGEVIGAIGLRPGARRRGPRPALRITDLVVAESHRGGGHGRALMAAAAAEAEARAASRIEVISHNRRLEAHAFYESRRLRDPLARLPSRPRLSPGTEGVGFEPTRRLARPNGFQGRRIQPLCHPS